jgi:hypothetical protein
MRKKDVKPHIWPEGTEALLHHKTATQHNNANHSPMGRGPRPYKTHALRSKIPLETPRAAREAQIRGLFALDFDVWVRSVAEKRLPLPPPPQALVACRKSQSPTELAPSSSSRPSPSHVRSLRSLLLFTSALDRRLKFYTPRGQWYQVLMLMLIVFTLLIFALCQWRSRF